MELLCKSSMMGQPPKSASIYKWKNELDIWNSNTIGLGWSLESIGIICPAKTKEYWDQAIVSHGPLTFHIFPTDS